MADANDLKNSGLTGRDNLLKLVRGIATADDIASAGDSLRLYCESLDTHLLSIKFCDSANLGTTIRPFSAYPKAVSLVGQQIQVQGGCPFAKEAMRRLSAFDSRSIDRSQYDTFLDRRFFVEVDRTGYQHIAIVPIMLGRAVALFTIGLNGQPFKGALREQIVEAIGQAVPAFIGRFQGIKTLFEQKHLSTLERKVLQLVCEGQEAAEVETQTGLSEFTVSLLMKNAARKLDVSSTESLIFRALALGEISQPPTMPPLEGDDSTQ